MSSEIQVVNQKPSTEFSSQPHNQLFRVGGAAGLLCALMYFITLAVYVPATRAAPAPETPLEWFSLFQQSPITGLFFLGLADIVILILWGPMCLAFYEALKDKNKAWAQIAVVFVFVGIAVFLATNTAFSMLYLSKEYTSASTGPEQSLILAAGESMLAASMGTGGRYTGMPLAWLSGLIFSILMLRSEHFSKAAGWTGIPGLGLLMLSIPFAHYTTGGDTSSFQTLMISVTYIGGGLLSLAWYILAGLSLIKLARP
ncbi:MAG: DUF4386 family protein [Anaerolineales bacterium]|nr:DUF4386 family protein [Anaerolineales bacterium]